MVLNLTNGMSYEYFYYLIQNDETLCSASLPMSFEERVAAVGIATQFQENSNQIFKMVEEETDNAKTQVCLSTFQRKMEKKQIMQKLRYSEINMIC